MKLAAMLLLIFLGPVQDSFIRFSYCRENARGVFETQCVNLNPQGTGEAQLRRRGAQVAVTSLELSATGRARFLRVLQDTNNLEAADRYESKRKVADLGLKRLVLDLPAGQRNAEFNYSDLKEVNALATFFDGLINQVVLVSELDTALLFDRLSVPERLERLESELASNRIGDPEGLGPMLEKIEKDTRVMNYARDHARKLKAQVASGKP